MKKKRTGKRTALNGIVYEGLLAQPITLKWSASAKGLFSSAQDLEAADRDFNDRLFQARLEKIGPLFAKFDISGDDAQGWMKLAYRLACAHVPGFQTAANPGRPNSTGLDLELALRVLLWRRTHPGESDTKACKALTERASSPLSPLTWQTALRRYNRVKTPIHKMFAGIPTVELETILSKRG